MHFTKNNTFSAITLGGLIILASALAAGCGLLDSRKAEYRSVQKSKPLDIPPELTAPAKDDRYTVSEASSKGTTFSSYSAERAAAKNSVVEGETKAAPVASAQTDKFLVQRAGSHRWLVAPGTPAQLFPQIRSFIEARGLAVASESPTLGLIETEWAEKTVYVPESGIRGQLAKALGSIYSTSERDKYRIRLEVGQDVGTTDIFVSHRGVEEVYVSEYRDETRWQPRATDPGLEGEMIARLIQHLGVEEKRVATVMAAVTTVADGDRARLIESGAKLMLEVDERFDRAWRRIGLALDRNGFTVEDRDRANGVYYVRYNDPLADKKSVSKGWLDSIAFWRDDQVEAELPSALRISVDRSGQNVSRVEVQEKAGLGITTPTARKILDIIRNELK